jgi:hypothetical protein
MKSLKNLLIALAFLIGSALVITALALCFVELFIGGVA